MMPGLTGVDVLERIRADPKLRNQKVAFLTVVHHLGEYGIDTLKRLDPAEYFVKPIDVGDFKKRLKVLLSS
jgi:CheY-like chemotaxis protein